MTSSQAILTVLIILAFLIACAGFALYMNRKQGL